MLDKAFEVGILLAQFVLFQFGETAEFHFDNGEGLRLCKVEMC